MLKALFQTKDGAVNAIAAALALVRRGFYSPDEQRVMSAGAQAIWAAGGPTTEDERRVLAIAERMMFGTPAVDRPPVPAALLKPIDEAAAVRADKEAAAGQALERLALAERNVNRKPGNRQAIDATHEAREAYRVARADLERAQAELTARQLDVAAWRRDELIAAQQNGA